MSHKNCFEVREATYSDFQDLLKLYLNFYRELRLKQGLDIPDINEYEKDLETIFGRDKIFIAYYDEIPLGYVRISERDGSYWIEEVYVEKRYRRKGVGKSLVEKAEEYIKNFDSYSYIMVLPQDKDSINFWLKMGYIILNTIELTKNLNEKYGLSDSRTITIFGYPLELYKWREEYYSEIELEYLKAVDEFFRAGGNRETYLKIVTDALKRYISRLK